MEATVVVITHNAQAALRRCLESARRFSPGGTPIVVVDNGSGDGTRRFLRGLARGPAGPTVVLSGANQGFSRAANQAAAMVKTPWIAFLDDDVQVGPGWLSRLLRSGLAQPRVAAVGCRVVSDWRIFSAEIVPLAGAAGLGERDLGQRSYVRTCEAVCGACLLVRRELFDQGARFDPRFFPCQAEDVDLCLEIRRRGYRVLYNGGIAVRHEGLGRSGGRGDLNASALARKWDVFRALPRRDSHPWDRLTFGIFRAILERRFREALPLCRRLEAGHPAPGPARYYRGRALAGQGRWDQARAAFEAALEDRPFRSSSLGLSCWAALDWARARAAGGLTPAAPDLKLVGSVRQAVL